LFRMLVTFCLVLTTAALAQNTSTALRRPRGLYAVINIESDVAAEQQKNPSITSGQLDAYFNAFYQDLLNNPAVSGLTIQGHWDTFNPNPPTAANAYFWNYLDAAFTQAAAWNAGNPTQYPKGIQLILTPGFQSPQWLLKQLTPCDGLFQTPPVTPSSTCGTITTTGYQEGGDSPLLPMPWNSVYKAAWGVFLQAVQARYGTNPIFVSIAVAGPTAASAEMTTVSNATAPAQPQLGGIMPNQIWRQLLPFFYPTQPTYQNTDQAFIDEWEHSIDLYGQIFSGITITATTGAGLPNLNGTYTLPAVLSADCPNPSMECAAVATILTYFMEPSVGGNNTKSEQTSGMEAARAALADSGAGGAKFIAQITSQLSGPAQVLGGAQFNTRFSSDTLGEGCTAAWPPDQSDTPPACTIPASCTVDACIPVTCIPQACLAIGVTQATLAPFGTFGKVPNSDLIPPEQALYNVLTYFFDGTPVAAAFGATPGTAPMNYVQVYEQDIQYAEANASAPAKIVHPDGTIVSTTAQALLNQASALLLSISEPALLPAISASGIVPGNVQPGEWVSIFGSSLALGAANWTGNFPTSLGGVGVTVDGRPAYLSYVSPAQINLQVPADSASGQVAVVVTTPTGSAKSTVNLTQFSPEFFLLDATHVAGIILRTNGKGAYGGGTYDILGPTGSSLGYPTVAAKEGDTVELFGTGFGPTTPTVTPGQLFSGAATTNSAVTLNINGVAVTPLFSGISGAGLYQLNLTIPAGLGSGDVSLLAKVGSAQSQSGVVISVQ
jgi:uncharacterized protein (TIGR03437 family)